MRQTLCWHGRTTGCLTMSLHTGQCSSRSRLFMLDCRGQRNEGLWSAEVAQHYFTILTKYPKISQLVENYRTTTEEKKTENLAQLIQGNASPIPEVSGIWKDVDSQVKLVHLLSYAKYFSIAATGKFKFSGLRFDLLDNIWAVWGHIIYFLVWSWSF